MVNVNGVHLAVEEFGDRDDPAILLIAGAASSMDWWDTEFCERLAAGDRRVVRYDLRDTGVSTSYPAGQAGYTGDDLVDDAVGLIGELGLAPVHLAGISLGGGIALQITIRYPQLVASLAVLSSTPGDSGEEAPDLPPMDPEITAAFDRGWPTPDWSIEEEVALYFIHTEEVFSGSIPVDTDRIRRIVGELVARGGSSATAENHYLALGRGEPRSALADISVPTLVVHGTRDPLFPIEHGEAMANEIPGAVLLPVEGMGHQNPPPETWDDIIPAILQNTARTSEDA